MEEKKWTHIWMNKPKRNLAYSDYGVDFYLELEDTSCNKLILQSNSPQDAKHRVLYEARHRHELQDCPAFILIHEQGLDVSLAMELSLEDMESLVEVLQKGIEYLKE